MTGPSVLSALLLSLPLVLLACWAGGALCRRLGQPPVIGEMAAGILLGPTLLGRVWPTGAATLFPPALAPGPRAHPDRPRPGPHPRGHPGPDLRLIGPQLYAMLILMALTATAVTSPALTALMPKEAVRGTQGAEPELVAAGLRGGAGQVRRAGCGCDRTKTSRGAARNSVRTTNGSDRMDRAATPGGTP